MTEPDPAGASTATGTMKPRPVPVLGDADRVRALSRLGLSESEDATMEHYARRVRDAIGVPVALVSLVHVDRQVFPGMVGLPEPWATARCTPLTHSFCQYVVSSRNPLVISDARTHPWVRDNLAVAELGVIAYAGIPLTDGAGRVLGSLCAIDTTPRRWSDTELALLGEIAEECCAELRRRAARQHAEREHSPEGEAETRLRAEVRRAEVLLAASQSLALATSFEDLRVRAGQVAILADLAPTHLSLVVSGEDGQLHRIPDPMAEPGPEDRDPWRDFATNAPLPSAAVMKDRRILRYTDRDSFAADFPSAVLELVVARGLHAITAVPLISDRGPVGALVLGWARHRNVSVDLTMITSIAGLLAQAIGRVRLMAHRASVAHQLQAAMLPSLPAIDGLKLGARYLPADRRADVGGDWYDVIRLPRTNRPYPSPEPGSGPVAASIGDIVGHDLRAATIMGQVRAMMRQACWTTACHSPAAVVSDLEDACAGVGVAATGTVVLARLAPLHDETGRWAMTWTNAGHPPPMIIAPDGTTLLAEAHDILLGYRHLTHTPRRDHRITIEPGTTVLLYTDGLIERHGHDADHGIANLRALLSTLGERDPQDIVDTALKTLATQARDDTAALAITIDRLGGD